MEENNKLYAVVLAAGKGTRMNSELPKVLMEVDGKPMIFFVLENLKPLNLTEIVIVVGYKKEYLIEKINEYIQKTNFSILIRFAEQKEQLGTGHAFLMTEPLLKNVKGYVLVTAGDMPFLSTDSFKSLFSKIQEENTVGAILTSYMEDPYGYGRIVRDKNQLLDKIVEEKDATEEIKKIKEVNTGCYVFTLPEIFDILKKIKNNNKQGEYYLPDVIEIYKQEKKHFSCYTLKDSREAMGANTKEELKKLNEIYKNYIKKD
ncbi:MAG: sugar phosphate nucleotidyltransferase [Leptonema sp. (in: bacteria)]